MYSDAIESLDLCACHKYSRKWPKYFKAQKSNVGGALQYQGPWFDPELELQSMWCLQISLYLQGQFLSTSKKACW